MIMIHFGSFLSLSISSIIILVVLLSCRPTAAANLAVSPAKGGNRGGSAPSGDHPERRDDLPPYFCAKKCTSVNPGCHWAYSGACKCYAEPVWLEYWHIGNCGPVPKSGFQISRFPSRLPPSSSQHSPRSYRPSYNPYSAQQRIDAYSRATEQYASDTPATVPQVLPQLDAYVASAILPSPCNTSYVSFACVDSTDGIVHEPLQNWLGALLPEGAKSIPPVPEKFRSIRGREGGVHEGSVS